jgi:hypothetical protein
MLRRPPEPVKASSLTRTGSSLISSPRGGPLKPSFGLSGAVLRLKRSSCLEESGGHPGNVLSVPARVVRFTPSAPLGCRNIFHIDIGQAGNDTSVGISTMSSCLGALLVALLILSASASDALAGQFKKAAYYRAGQQPRHVVAGHLTASGNLDLVFADYLSNQVVTLLGNGDGTFQKPIQSPAPSPISLAVGDFNEDGNLDLAVVETNGTGDGAFAIFLGDGKSGFKLSASYPIGVESVNVAVADFNGDGHLDAAVTNQGFESRTM